MVSRARSKAAKPRAAAAKVAAPPSRAIAGWLAISFVLGFAALIVLATLSVPLGQGYFFFRYSDLRGLRTLRALPVLLVAGGFCGAVHLLMRPERRRRRSGVLLLCAALLAMGGWS